MRITPNMLDIYKRLRDEGRPGVPLYSDGGHVRKSIYARLGAQAQ